MKSNDTALVLIDYQGKLAKVMHERYALADKMERLVKGAKLLEIPIIWVEQYPQGLGPTAPVIQELLTDHVPIAKMDFSACRHEDFQEKLQTINRKNIIVAGIEAHICVYQTVKELLAMDYYVEYVCDAISSRTVEDKQMAMKKMDCLGALPTSVEMVLFELMGSATHPIFKKISALIK